MVKPGVRAEELRECEHGGFAVRGVTDFSVNLNPYGPPDFVFNVLKACMGEIKNYPDVESVQLKALIARKFGCLESEVLVGAGVSELIQLVAIGFVKKRAVIPAYTYGEYEKSVRMMGADVKKIEMPGLELKPELISEAMQPDDVVFLCNPNNPTGQYIPDDGLSLLIDEAERVDALLVLDEAYIDFVNDAFPSHSYLSSTGNLLILRSLTKSFAIPGVRVGYALGSETIISVLRQLKAPWSVSVFAQRIGEAVLGAAGDKFIEDTRGKISKSKRRLERELGVHSDANFYIFDTGRVASEVRAELLSRGLAVRDCTSFGLPSHIRFAVRKDEENEILMEMLKNSKKQH